MRGEIWMDMRSDHQKGLSYTELSRKYHIDPRTAKKYAQSETKPVYELSEPKPSKLDAYKHQTDLWLGGSSIFGDTDTGEAGGEGLHGEIQHRQGICSG